MPAPDPDGIYLDEHEGGGFTVTAEVWAEGNRRSRVARMKHIARNVRWGGWRCRRCGEPVPLYKRADARFCSEGCRKAAARERRVSRASASAVQREQD